MTKEQKISHIMHGFIGDVFGAGSVKHQIVDKTTREQSRLEWIGGCFGCYIGGKKIDAFIIQHDDSLTVNLL